MSEVPSPQPETSPSDTSEQAPRLVSSESLLAGRRELLIQHGKEQYRLRLTASNKLILVK